MTDPYPQEFRALTAEDFKPPAGSDHELTYVVDKYLRFHLRPVDSSYVVFAEWTIPLGDQMPKSEAEWSKALAIVNEIYLNYMVATKIKYPEHEKK